MNTIQKISGALLVASLGLGAAPARAANYVHYITATTCGNWNDAGVRGSTTDGNSTDYQIGYSMQLPHEQAAYYEFDLDSVKGQTVTACTFLIPGSTDYNITSQWAASGVNENNLNCTQQFKIGLRPQGSDTLTQILDDNDNTTIYTDGADANRNQDLGYGWVMEGLHLNRAFDTFHYNTARLQNEVNAGGNWVFWVCDDYDTGAGSENYIWGSTTYNTGLVLEVTTTTAPSGTPPALLPGALANGTYVIINKSTGLALDVFGRHTANGTVVDTWTDNGGTNQQWQVTSLGNDSYEVLGVQSGKALEVAGQSLAVGAPTDISTYVNQGNQQWIITPGLTPGTYTIEAAQDGYFMAPTTQGNANAMNPNDGDTDQQWIFEAP